MNFEKKAKKVSGEWEIDGPATFGEPGYYQIVLGGIPSALIGADFEVEGTLEDVLEELKRIGSDLIGSDLDEEDYEMYFPTTVSVFTDGKMSESEIRNLVRKYGLELVEFS